MVFIGSVTEGKKGHVDGLCAAARNSVALTASRSDWRGQQSSTLMFLRGPPLSATWGGPHARL